MKLFTIMDTSFRPRLLSVDEIQINTLSSTMIDENNSNSTFDEIVKSKPNVLYERSDSSILGSYVVDYGPVRVRHRRSASQTLATGRRSKDEPLYGEEAIKREIRRAKNRIAARELKKDRDQIEIDLVQKIQQLEEEKNDLQTQHKILEERRAQLNRAVYNAKQAALVPLITDMNISLFFPSQDQKNLLIDFYSLLQNIDE